MTTAGKVIEVNPGKEMTVIIVEWENGVTQRFGTTSRALQHVGVAVVYDGKALQEAASPRTWPL